jgi:hypothetical protein
LKRDIRFKPLEYLCEDMDDDILEESSWHGWRRVI